MGRVRPTNDGEQIIDFLESLEQNFIFRRSVVVVLLHIRVSTRVDVIFLSEFWNYLLE